VNGDELMLLFEAHCDHATPLNLTWHPYFNLSGEARRPASEQHLRISASRYLPVSDSQLIPTGTLASVADTPFDFRELRALGPSGADYDQCWVLDAARDCDAELFSPHSGVTLKLLSERRALQFYGGQGLTRQHPGLSGLCLEPQDFPNAPNEPRFPPAILKPGTAYVTMFRYRFSVGEWRP
jgi:aldose 1-epimerase